MVPIVEEIISKIINDALAVLKASPDLLYEVFDKDNMPFVENLKDYISKNQIKTVMNFPREPTQLPCYCIMLGGENEDAESLGEYLEDDVILHPVTEECEVFKDASTGQFFIKLTHMPVLTEDIQIENIITGKDIETITQDSESPLMFYIEKGVSKGDTLKVHYTQITTDVSMGGTLFGFNYKVECWSDNANLTVYMYHLLKFIMLWKRPLIIELGILTPTLQGTDLEPVPEYFPSFVYRRALVFQGKMESSYNDLAFKDKWKEVEKITTHEHFYHSDKVTIQGGEDRYDAT